MLKNLILSLSSAILLSCPWLGAPGYTLFFGLVPLLIISDSYREKKKSFWRVFGWMSLAFGLWSLITTWWIWYAAWIGTVLSVLITILLFGGIFMIYHAVSRKFPSVLAFTIFIAGWISAEYLYTCGEVSFPWIMLGNGFANDIRSVQWYDTTGIFGGTLWVLLVNILFFLAYRSCRKKIMISAVTLLVLPLAISLIKYYTYTEKNDPVRVSVVQPNFDPYTEKFNMNPAQMTSVMASLAGESGSETDYIVLPETAIDDGIWENDPGRSYSISVMTELMRNNYPNSSLITGATSYMLYDSPAEATPTARTSRDRSYYYDAYNSALMIDKDGLQDIHHKSKLVVGVEKMPYYSVLKHLEFLIVDLGGISGQLGTDDERTVFSDNRGRKSGTAICFESIYGSYYSEFARNGAEIMFIITNDGWWGNTAGHRQHFSYARLRAIETRRSIGRSANTGISGFIDQKGRVLQKTRWAEQIVIQQELSYNSKITFYTKYGDIIAKGSVLVFLLSLLYLIPYTIKRKQHLIG